MESDKQQAPNSETTADGSDEVAGHRAHFGQEQAEAAMPSDESDEVGPEVEGHRARFGQENTPPDAS